MGIEFGREDAFVAEHFLDGAEIRAVLYEVRCEGVSESASAGSGRTAMYASTASCAAPPIGTSLSLLPFPKILTNPSSL